MKPLDKNTSLRTNYTAFESETLACFESHVKITLFKIVPIINIIIEMKSDLYVIKYADDVDFVCDKNVFKSKTPVSDYFGPHQFDVEIISIEKSLAQLRDSNQ